MLEFEILARGLYRTEQLDIAYDPSSHMPLTPTIQAEMDMLWQQKLATAREEGFPLFDSQLFRLVKVEAWSDGTLHLVLGNTSYKEYTTTRAKWDKPPPRAATRVPSPPNPTPAPTRPRRLLKLPYEKLTPQGHRWSDNQELSNPLAVCSVIETSDGYMLYEKRQKVAVHSGRYHIIAGFFERNRDTDAATRPDPFGAMLREIREETGIQISDIQEQYCLGAVYDVSIPHGELCFFTRLNIPLAEVHMRTPEDDEVQHLLSLYVTAESLRDFVLTNHGNISPTGEPNLLMYGAMRFGDGWFEEVIR